MVLILVSWKCSWKSLAISPMITVRDRIQQEKSTVSHALFVNKRRQHAHIQQVIHGMPSYRIASCGLCTFEPSNNDTFWHFERIGKKDTHGFRRSKLMYAEAQPTPACSSASFGFGCYSCLRIVYAKHIGEGAGKFSVRWIGPFPKKIGSNRNFCVVHFFSLSGKYLQNWGYLP